MERNKTTTFGNNFVNINIDYMKFKLPDNSKNLIIRNSKYFYKNSKNGNFHIITKNNIGFFIKPQESWWCKFESTNLDKLFKLMEVYDE